jgi:predicted CXXCH cytochrome family protein
MKSALSESKFKHGAIRSGECSACHNAHGANQHSLLVRDFPASSYANFDLKKYDLCFASCHSPQMVLLAKTTSLTNFRNGDDNLHFVHVNRSEKGRSCKTCHAVHGSNLPNHMASEVPFERSDWAMPIEFQKSGTGGSCTPGCHAPRTYDRNAALTTLPTTIPTTRGSP